MFILTVGCVYRIQLFVFTEVARRMFRRFRRFRAKTSYSPVGHENIPVGRAEGSPLLFSVQISGKQVYIKKGHTAMDVLPWRGQ
jgi:hypothetical protein